jgi:hypothetical protein
MIKELKIQKYINDQKINERFNRLTNVPPEVKMTYLLLKGYAAKKGYTWVSEETLAPALGVSKTNRETVSRYVNTLVFLGLVQVKKPYQINQGQLDPKDWDNLCKQKNTKNYYFVKKLDEQLLSRIDKVSKDDIARYYQKRKSKSKPDEWNYL